MESNKTCNCNCGENKETTSTLPVSEETCNYLQRLGMGVDARLEVINKIFTNHANDADDSVLESKPFKKYHSEFEELNAEYTQAKVEFENEIKPIVYEKAGNGANFRWSINDFLAKEVVITIL